MEDYAAEEANALSKAWGSGVVRVRAVSRQGCGGEAEPSVCCLRQQKILFSWLGLSPVCFAINLLI